MINKEVEIKALRNAYSSLVDLILKKSNLKNLPYIIILVKKDILKMFKIHKKLGKEIGIDNIKTLKDFNISRLRERF